MVVVVHPMQGLRVDTSLFPSPSAHAIFGSRSVAHTNGGHRWCEHSPYCDFPWVNLDLGCTWVLVYQVRIFLLDKNERQNSPEFFLNFRVKCATKDRTNQQWHLTKWRMLHCSTDSKNHLTSGDKFVTPHAELANNSACTQ